MRSSAPIHRLLRGLTALLAILVIGTAGYWIIEGWSLIDAFYMTVVTISTVGYDEVYPLSTDGQIFSIALILGGVGTVLYIMTSVVQYFLEGEFGIRLGKQRMDAKIKKLHNHFILCGYGRVGQGIADALKQEAAEFIVIDQDEESAAKARQNNHLTIQDNATKNEVLRQAGIDSARGLIAALGNDADNTYTILAARGLNPALAIIARASDDEAMIRLQQAGADHVIAPEVIGGQRMARLALRPAAIQFIETVFSSHEEEILIEEIETGKESTLIGSTVNQIENRFPRIKILALKREDGNLILNPKPNNIIEKSSIFTAFGPAEQLQALEGCCETGKSTNR